eukprot:4612860-Pleurochrysis_carterae.AAC.6
MQSSLYICRKQLGRTVRQSLDLDNAKDSRTTVFISHKSMRRFANDAAEHGHIYYTFRLKSQRARTSWRGAACGGHLAGRRALRHCGVARQLAGAAQLEYGTATH